MAAKGFSVYSPITQGHRIADFLLEEFRADSAFWVDKVMPFLMGCNMIVVLLIPGWDISHGIKEELKVARTYDIPVQFLLPITDSESCNEYNYMLLKDISDDTE